MTERGVGGLGRRKGKLSVEDQTVYKYTERETDTAENK